MDTEQLILNRPSRSDAPRHARLHSTSLAAAVFVPTLSLLGAVYFIGLKKGIPFGALSRDAAALAKLPYYSAWISYLGSVLWCAAASVCLFCYFATRRSIVQRDWSRFFLAWGLLSSALMADDLFMLHDGFVPRFFGDRDRAVAVLYAISAVICVGVSWRAMRQTRWGFLIAAMFFLGCSVMFDTFIVRVDESYRHIAEDGPKLMGIVSWSTFLIGGCLTGIQQNCSSKTQSGEAGEA